MRGQNLESNRPNKCKSLFSKCLSFFKNDQMLLATSVGAGTLAAGSVVWAFPPVFMAICASISLSTLYGFMYKGLNGTSANFEQTKKEINDLIETAFNKQYIDENLKFECHKLLKDVPSSFNQTPQIISVLGGMLATATGITNIVRATYSESDSVNQQNDANLTGDTIAVIGNGLCTLTAFSSLVQHNAKLHELTNCKFKVMKDIQKSLENKLHPPEQFSETDKADKKTQPRG